MAAVVDCVKDKGFRVLMRQKNSNLHWIECSRAGYPAAKTLDGKCRIREPSQKVGCKWRVNITIGLGGKATISKIFDEHSNHELDYTVLEIPPVSDDGIINELSESDMEFIRSAAGVKQMRGQALVATLIAIHYGHVPNATFSPTMQTKINNTLTAARTAAYSRGCDASAFIAKIAGLNAVGGYAAWELDPADGRLIRAMWALPGMRAAAQQFGNVALHVS